jgi:hypothetical protein
MISERTSSPIKNSSTDEWSVDFGIEKDNKKDLSQYIRGDIFFH